MSVQLWRQGIVYPIRAPGRLFGDTRRTAQLSCSQTPGCSCNMTEQGNCGQWGEYLVRGDKCTNAVRALIGCMDVFGAPPGTSLPLSQLFLLRFLECSSPSFSRKATRSRPSFQAF